MLTNYIMGGFIMYVKNIMTTNPYTVTRDTTIAEGLEIMREKGVRRLPVLDGDDLVGIITERKLLEVSPSPATTLSVFELNYLLSKTKIGSMMTRDVITVSPDTLLEVAASIMKENKFGGIPVVEDDKLVGIITETDIFGAFVEVFGLEDNDSKIHIKVKDNKPGVLADITRLIANFDVSITHMALFRDTIMLRVNTPNLKPILNELENKNFDVVYFFTSED